MEKKIGCLVMAAGNSRRFGDNKLAAQFEGKSLIQRALEAVPEILETVVVSQYPEVKSLAESYEFAYLYNAHPDWGISHTIFLGTKHLQKCDGILYLVSDQPLLKKSSVQTVVNRWLTNPNCIVSLAHNGKRGNPCLFPSEFYPELMRLKEDNGGNTIIRRNMDRLVTVDAQELELTDVDTVQALKDLTKQAAKTQTTSNLVTT